MFLLVEKQKNNFCMGVAGREGCLPVCGGLQKGVLPCVYEGEGVVRQKYGTVFF